MLFLQLHHGEINQYENGRKDAAHPPRLRGDGKASRRNERAQIKGVTRVTIRAAIDQPLIFRQMPGRPAAQREPE
jgi:hypothetical protein